MSNQDIDSAVRQASEIAEIKALLSSKPNILVTFGAVLAGLALMAGPLAIFLPREFDHLNDGIAEIRLELNSAIATIEAAKNSSDRAAANTQEISDSIDGLIEAIARNSARILDPSQYDIYKEILSADLFVNFEASGFFSELYFSDFNSSKWIFIDKAIYNLLEAQTQDEFERSLSREEVRLFIESGPPNLWSSWGNYSSKDLGDLPR